MMMINIELKYVWQVQYTNIKKCSSWSFRDRHRINTSDQRLSVTRGKSSCILLTSFSSPSQLNAIIIIIIHSTIIYKLTSHMLEKEWARFNPFLHTAYSYWWSEKILLSLEKITFLFLVLIKVLYMQSSKEQSLVIQN